MGVNMFDRIISLIGKEKFEKVKLVKPNIAFNRLDIKFENDFELLEIQYNSKIQYVTIHLAPYYCQLGVYMMELDKKVFDAMIKFIVKTFKINRFYLVQSVNGNKQAIKSGHWLLSLPDTQEEFDKRFSSRTRYNRRIKRKNLEKDYDCKFTHHKISELDEKFFEDFKVQVSGYNANYTRKVGDVTGDPYMDYLNKYNTINTGVKGNVTYKEMLTLGLEWDKTEFKQKDLLSDTEKINRSRENAAAYLQAVLTFGDLTLIPVVRGDKNTDYEDVFTPALSAVYKLTDEIKVSGNVSKVWNAPTFGQIYGDDTWYAPAPNLKPEKGISSDLGIEYNNGTIGIGVTGFYITSEDLIQNIYDPETYKYIAQNVDEARQYGYEVEANYNMTKDIKHKLNYTYLRAENTKTHTDLIYKPMHTLNYVLSVSPIKQLKVTADVNKSEKM